MSIPLAAHWAFYDLRCRQTDRGRVNDLGYGREELLWQILKAIESGTPFDEDCLRRLDRVPWNRAKKHRRLRKYLAHHFSAGSQPIPAVETAESLDEIRGRLSPVEWSVEWRLASGQRYAEIATDLGLSPHALKERVYRWRIRLRRELRAA